MAITGLSGSGKSSLAFDIIYAEGQRKCVESLSAGTPKGVIFISHLESNNGGLTDWLILWGYSNGCERFNGYRVAQRNLTGIDSTASAHESAGYESEGKGPGDRKMFRLKGRLQASTPAGYRRAGSINVL